MAYLYFVVNWMDFIFISTTQKGKIVEPIEICEKMKIGKRMFLNGIEYYSIQYQARGKYELHMAFRVGKSPKVLELVAVDNADTGE